MRAASVVAVLGLLWFHFANSTKIFECPQPQAIDPCVCTSEFVTEIVCDNGTNFPLMKEEQEKFFLYNIAINNLAKKSIPSGFLKGLSTTVLTMKDSVVESISKDAFEDARNDLQYVTISNISLKAIPVAPFTNLTNLKWFAVINSKLITSIKKTDIDQLPSTVFLLNLSGNNISTVDSSAFAKLINLQGLYLQRNLLTQLPELQLSHWLRRLDLAFNPFRRFPVNVTLQLPIGAHCDLRSVNISLVPGKSVMTQLAAKEIEVNLYENPLNCTCDLKWIPKFKADHGNLPVIGKCKGDSKRKNRYTWHLSEEDFTDC